MLYLVVLILCIFSAFLSYIQSIDEKSSNSYYYSGFDLSDFTLMELLSGFFIAVFIVMTFMIILSLTGKEQTYNLYVQERASLQYQLDCGVYEPLSSNERFDNTSKQNLYSKVEQFNKDLGIYKGGKSNIWISIFYQADLNDIDYIQYPERESWIDKADGVQKYEFTIN